MKVVFLKYAQQELDDAAYFYEMEFRGLGKNFKTEVKKAISRIAEYPEAWPQEYGDVRKCLIHKFPYSILYSVEGEHIVIIAVAHQHRKPDYWIERDEVLLLGRRFSMLRKFSED